MKTPLLVALLLFGAAFPVRAAERPDVKTEDKNGDGRVDLWAYLKDGKTFRTERDTNADGKPDRFSLFIKGRDLVLRETDANFDGKIDQRALASWDGNKKIPVGGVPARSIPNPGYDNIWKEVDSDFDGKLDTVREKGKKGDPTGRIGKKMRTEPTLEIDGWEKNR